MVSQYWSVRWSLSLSFTLTQSQSGDLGHPVPISHEVSNHEDMEALEVSQSAQLTGCPGWLSRLTLLAGFIDLVFWLVWLCFLFALGLILLSNF